jgi:signal transduction histidine kinase/pSer/pThr/pTyr-binding forkhead associated (FHA) protein
VLTLLVLQGPDKGRRFELPDGQTLVGRDSRQLPITDNTVSRRHAELIPTEDGNWVLKDLASANGTYVNGTRVLRNTTLKAGDQIRVGRTLLVFGAQPGVSRASGGNVNLAGEESGMDSSIMHTVASNDDSMVLAVPEPAAAAVSNLRILYQLSASLGSAFDEDQVLEVVMDLIFEHIKADKGIVFMLDPQRGSEALVPKVVRARDETGETKTSGNGSQQPAANKTDGKSITARTDRDPGASRYPQPNEKIHASRTIINHVLTSGEGVLSSNAMADRRFSKGKSVHNLGIRSALCVPIKAKRLGGKADDKEGLEEIIGVIYVDSSVKNYTYSPDQLRLLTAIGLQTGLAIQNTKLYKTQLQAERMAAIGETTAALSHSIKNILQALRGGADVVEMGLKANNVGQSTKGWRVVDRNLEKIYNLTMNLLAYSKDREPQLQLVHPKKLIEECVELTATAAGGKGVMVVADVEPDHPAIPLDPDGMHQVLMNLLSNALDAVEPGQGLIRVVCRYEDEHQTSVMEVIDNGTGIPPTMSGHLFELFHSTKGNRGTGLGLAVARKIVEEHEGSISVKSSPTEGTVFTIRLPVDNAALADASKTHGPAR